MEFLLSLFLESQTVKLAQSNKVCVQANDVGSVIKDYKAWAPRVVAWVFPHEVYEKLGSGKNKHGRLYYKISSTPVGWSRANNFTVVSCD